MAGGRRIIKFSFVATGEGINPLPHPRGFDKNTKEVCNHMVFFCKPRLIGNNSGFNVQRKQTNQRSEKT
jgi:hypothetical protein